MISGTSICWNAIRRDYCLEASLRSLLSFCDEVIVVDGGSDDGTVELVQGLEDSRIKLFHTKVNPVKGAGPTWLRDWAEFARSKCSYEMHVHLQADEVFHDGETEFIRRIAKLSRSFIFHRYNFWLDKGHLLPPQHDIVNDWVLRLAPKERHFDIGGDAESLSDINPLYTWLGIFHYGFIRSPGALVEKARIMQESIMGGFDPLVERVEKEGIQCLSERYPISSLVKFTGTHPSFVQPWLEKISVEEEKKVLP